MSYTRFRPIRARRIIVGGVKVCSYRSWSSHCTDGFRLSTLSGGDHRCRSPLAVEFFFPSPIRRFEFTEVALEDDDHHHLPRSGSWCQKQFQGTTTARRCLQLLLRHRRKHHTAAQEQDGFQHLRRTRGPPCSSEEQPTQCHRCRPGDPVRGAFSPTETVPAAYSVPQEPSARAHHHPQLWSRFGVEPKTRGGA